MRICIFTENNYKGGLDTFLINLIKDWPDSKDIFTIVCNKDHPGLSHLETKLENTTFLKYSFLFTSKLFHGKANNLLLRTKLFRGIFYFIFRILEYPFISPFFVINLILFFKKNNFDNLLIVNGGYPGSLICRCASISWFLVTKKKSFLNFHNYSQKSSVYFSYIEKFLDYMVFSKSSYIISVSNSCMESIKNRGVYIDDSKLKVIYNGINISNINSTINTSKIENQKDYCLMLGTFESRKGHYFMFKAFKLVLKKYPNILLFVYGDGKEHEKNKILNFIDELDLRNNIFLHNFIIDPTYIIKNSKILLVPSQSYESFGLTIIEAMSLGIPIVATNVGGIPEVIKNSNAGLISDKDDIFSYANNIIKILSSQVLSDSLSKNGILHYKNNFTASKMSSEYYKLIKHE
jgi:glycosyltransferase involved in cell wall biosynthesis